MGCPLLPGGIFSAQGSNCHVLHLLHWKAGSLSLCHLGSPIQLQFNLYESNYWYFPNDSILSQISFHPTRRASQVVLVVKNAPANAGDTGFDPWVRKIPWGRIWQPTPVSVPGESHGQLGYSQYGGRGRRDLSDLACTRLNHSTNHSIAEAKHLELTVGLSFFLTLQPTHLLTSEDRPKTSHPSLHLHYHTPSQCLHQLSPGTLNSLRHSFLPVSPAFQQLNPCPRNGSGTQVTNQFGSVLLLKLYSAPATIRIGQRDALAFAEPRRAVPASHSAPGSSVATKLLHASLLAGPQTHHVALYFRRTDPAVPRIFTSTSSAQYQHIIS